MLLLLPPAPRSWLSCGEFVEPCRKFSAVSALPVIVSVAILAFLLRAPAGAEQARPCERFSENSASCKICRAEGRTDCVRSDATVALPAGSCPSLTLPEAPVESCGSISAKQGGALADAYDRWVSQLRNLNVEETADERRALTIYERDGVCEEMVPVIAPKAEQLRCINGRKALEHIAKIAECVKARANALRDEYVAIDFTKSTSTNRIAINPRKEREFRTLTTVQLRLERTIDEASGELRKIGQWLSDYDRYLRQCKS